MAIYQVGPPTGEIRGSIGGLTFSRNSSGPYVRTRCTPVNPNSPLQQQRRAAFQAAAAAWSAILGNENREQWNAWAAQISWLNSLGQVTKLSGFQHWVRLYTLKMLAGQNSPVCPTEMNLPEPIQGMAVAATDDGNLSFSWTAGQAWAAESGAFAMFFATDQINTSRSFLGARYKYVGKVAGAVVPPTSPQVLISPWPVLTAGQKIQVYCRILRSELGASEPVYAVDEITAS